MAMSGFRLMTRGELNRISKARGFFSSGIQSALTDIGRKNVKTARELIRDKKKTGRIYTRTRNGRRVRHQASAPGEAPANFTGFLIKQTAFEVSGHRFMKFGNRAPYSAFLELGTKNMAARPFLIKAIKENEGYALSSLSSGPASVMRIK
tara:strand:- start:13455 stop:13904 length:450 start_codon:yes stop_codon:yes gene_type:complete